MLAFPEVPPDDPAARPLPRREALRATFLERLKARCPHEGGDTGRQNDRLLPPTIRPEETDCGAPPVHPPAEASRSCSFPKSSLMGRGGRRSPRASSGKRKRSF